ncbi:hypothetical protein ACWDYH_35810 [Nocardia goodfellowii]
MQTRPQRAADSLERSGHHRTGIDFAPIPIARFTDASTRALLANDGTTTVLLEAVLRAPVSVTVADQFRAQPYALSAETRRALHLTNGQTVVIRQSVLLSPDRQPVSWNRLIIVAIPGHRLDPLAEDRHTPLGTAMAAAGIAGYRRTLAIGHRPWPPTGSRAAAKTYLADIDGRPRLHSTEIYNPDLFPAALE